MESIRDIVSDTGFSGVIRVDIGGETQFCEAFGMAHRGLEVPISVDTQFGIASGGKAFTALAVVCLIEDDALSLQTKARSVLGADLPLIADDVTVGHLLAHRSGIGDYIDEEDDSLAFDDYVMTSPVHQLATTEAFLSELDGHPTKFKAGERFTYSNAGYVVLALMAERVSGMPYHDLVQDRVLAPAGLTDTGFLRSDEPSGRMAIGYLYRDGLRTNLLHLPVRGNGDGGIYTTVGDVHTFWDAFFDCRIVPRHWVEEMTRPHSDAPEEEARYGLGFWLAEIGPIVNLIGGDAGVSFFTAHDPSSQSTWTVVSNTSEGAWPVATRLWDAALNASTDRRNGQP